MPITGFERNQQALEEEKARQEKTGGEYGANADMLYLRPGQTMIRVLPPYSAQGVFFKRIYKHRVKVGDDVFYGLCPRMNLDQDCPVCNKGEELYVTKDEQAMALSKELTPRAYYLYNVICYSAPADSKGEMPVPGKVYVLETGVMVHRQILEIDQDEAMGSADITNVSSGVDLFVKRTGKGLDTRYSVHARGGARTNLLEWLQSGDIDPNSLSLFDLDKVYEVPSQERLESVANRIRVPGLVQATPTFQTAAAPALAAPPAPPTSAAPAPMAPPAATVAVGVPAIPPPPRRG